MPQTTISKLKPGLHVRQRSTKKEGVVTPPPQGTFAEPGGNWIDFGAGPELVREDDFDVVLRHVRLTIRHNPADPNDDFKHMGKLRRDLQVHSPVEVDPESPATQTRRDAARNVYFEFATPFPGEVRRVLRQCGHDGRVTMQELGEVGSVCTKCGHLSDFVTVCPNCRQRDISPCPRCREEIPRDHYLLAEGDLFACPNCQQRVSFRFNDLDSAARSVNDPVVLVEIAEG